MKPSFDRFDQVLAGFAIGDAISHEALELQRVFTGLGCSSTIFVEDGRIGPEMATRCRPLSQYDPSASGGVLLHYSIGSRATEAYLAARARKVMRYHNITPAEFYRGYDDELARRLSEARERLREVAVASDGIWAVSRFNADELRMAGAGRADVLPLLFSGAQFEGEPDSDILARFDRRGGLKNILFVGRMAPNKRVEDLISMFAWYNREINPYSRLLLVGSERSCPAYYSMLRLWAGCLGLANACFQGFATEAGLRAYYRVADLFVCASDHEGYCLPLLEAMHHGVPVLAKARGAVPDTMGCGGLTYDELNAAQLAGLTACVLEDADLHARVLATQAERLRALRARDAAAEISALLASL